MPPRRAANHKIYQRFAEVYDAMGADRHSHQMVEYTFRIARKFGLDITTVLDLCCGTGSALRLYSEIGWRATGVDASPAMLACARQKLKKYKVTLHQQTLPRFSIPIPRNGFDLVTSFYDSLNYLLTAGDLKAAFRSTFRHLRPGGLFVFDMNTAEALKIIWDGHIYADTRDDLAWIWKNIYDQKEQTADCIATFFVKTGAHQWERFTEIHTERAYPNGEIKRLLRDVGFVIKGFYRCHTFEAATARSYRICAVAQKPVSKRKAAR